MPHVICEITLTDGERAAIMGSAKDQTKADRDGVDLRVRLVLVKWIQRSRAGGTGAPQVAAEFSDRMDATGAPVWEVADKLPIALVLAALGDLARNIAPGQEKPGMRATTTSEGL